MIPIAGSAYTYTYATMGELIAWIIGWDLILEYAVSNMAVSVGFSASQARTLIEVQEALTLETLATKQDIERLDHKIEQDIERLNHKLEQHIERLDHKIDKLELALGRARRIDLRRRNQAFLRPGLCCRSTGGSLPDTAIVTREDSRARCVIKKGMRVSVQPGIIASKRRASIG